MTTNTLPETPLFTSLDDEALRAQYRQWRQLASRSAEMATFIGPKSRQGKANASQMGRIMHNVQLIERIADKRGISLSAPATEAPEATEAPRYWVVRAHLKDTPRSKTTRPYYSEGSGMWVMDGLKAQRFANQAAAQGWVDVACWAERNRGETVEVVPVH